MEKIKIIVCCHKDDIYKSSETFMPLHVGKAISKYNLGIQGDNTGENISAKNASYCELTGIYWAWKNLKDVDYIGFCHYRRYFDFNHLGRPFFPKTSFNTNQFDELNLNINKETEKWLKEGGCIISKACHIHASLYMQYCEGHYSPDIKLLGDIIRERFPQKYFQGFVDSMIKSNLFSPYNMFIMNWKDFDSYCTWLFSLLEEVENRIDITNYPSYQKRIFGFMGERLLNLYIKAEKMKVKQMPVIMVTDENDDEKMPLYKFLARNIIRDLATKLTAEVPIVK